MKCVVCFGLRGIVPVDHAKHVGGLIEVSLAEAVFLQLVDEDLGIALSHPAGQHQSVVGGGLGESLGCLLLGCLCFCCRFLSSLCFCCNVFRSGIGFGCRSGYG